VSAPLLIGPGLVARRVRLPRADVAMLRYLIEAYDGLANLHGARGDGARGDGARGDAASGLATVTLVTPASRVVELDGLLDDLAEELPLERLDAPAAGA
jgi:hypothetical protein